MKKWLTITLCFFIVLLIFVASAVFASGTKEKSAAKPADAMPFKGQTLTVSMWGFNMDLLEKNVIKPFEEKHGVKVVSETGNNSDRFTKMAARKGNPIVDVALFAGVYASKAVDEGLLKPYDPAKLSNLNKIIEPARDPLGGRYAIGYTIQHLGLCYRSDKVKPIKSWKDLSNPDLKGFLTIPHLNTTYGPTIIYMLSKAWGGSYDATDVGWAKMKELSASIVTAYNNSSQLQTLLQQEEVYAAPYTSFSWGNISAIGLPIVSVIPEEGLVGSFSMVSIANGTKNEDLAYLYIDHLLSYEVQLAEAMDLVDSPVRPDIKVPPEVAGKLTYGDELIKSLHFFSQKDMAAVEKDWIEKWNKIFTK
ncbi:MAG TPA: polyamine ABC transporter substrate-binding protein [Spirochaetia bacterium]|nr:polyamine ABC transporter substrate-binding protein [Spirochaetia bacterium]